MGFSDTFKGKQYKQELEILQEKYSNLEKLLTPEMRNAQTLETTLSQIRQNIVSGQETLNSLLSTISNTNKKIEDLNKVIADKQREIVSLDDELLVQEFGLYSPRYDFASSEQYKDKLTQIRNQQKYCIKNDIALLGNLNWTVNDSAAKGRKMVKDMQKLLLRAFNSECDETISKIKYNNIDASVKKIKSSAATISKLGTVMGISITEKYLNLKIQEAYLAVEYQQKKQQEKEDAKEARAQMREAAKLQKEIEEQRQKIEKEQAHYQKALLSVLKQLETSTGEERADLLAKCKELEKELGNIETSLKDIDYREANQRAGYVYIISNIGSFGEDIYKIGMTRRLDPQERIDELGDASVPFKFDVHAMIFSDDAPALETALHHAFESKKLNMVNSRREFFHVTLDEIKEVIKNNFDKTVEFIDIPDAEQYRISEKMRTDLNANQIA